MLPNGRQLDLAFHLVLVCYLCHLAGMAEIVNLRQVRKRLARNAANQDATAARARHGRSKAERDADMRANQAREAALDGARLDGSAGNSKRPE